MPVTRAEDGGAQTRPAGPFRGGGGGTRSRTHAPADVDVPSLPSELEPAGVAQHGTVRAEAQLGALRGERGGGEVSGEGDVSRWRKGDQG